MPPRPLFHNMCSIKLVLVLALFACAGPETAQRSEQPLTQLRAYAADGTEIATVPRQPSVELLVIGSAQDAGVPQLGCRAVCCEAVRAGKAPRRFAASVAIGDEASGQRWIIDAGPDLRAQEELLRNFPLTRREAHPRAALCEGILLTHAHMGHMAGLLQLGREAAAAKQMPVWCGPRLAEMLRTQAPWKLLVDAGHIDVRVVSAGECVALCAGLGATAVAVPHRAEFSETYAWLVRGPHRSVLYCPDIDSYDAFAGGADALLTLADMTLLDATFWSLDEIPGRGTADIPHPPLARTLQLFARRPDMLRRLWFTHFNHTNPAARPESPQAQQVRDTGAVLAREGDCIQL